MSDKQNIGLQVYIIVIESTEIDIVVAQPRDLRTVNNLYLYTPLRSMLQLKFSTHTHVFDQMLKKSV